jgi:hypothetical protein
MCKGFESQEQARRYQIERKINTNSNDSLIAKVLLSLLKQKFFPQQSGCGDQMPKKPNVFLEKY